MEIFYLPILVREKLLFIVHQTFQSLDFCSKPLFQTFESRFFGANDRLFISNLGFQRRNLCIGTLSELLGTLSFATGFCFGLLNGQLRLGYLFP